jgi:hypothetical protein
MGIEDVFKSRPDYVDLVKLIRSIQRAEGNIDCYGRQRQPCDQLNCAWRDHCFKAHPGGPPKANRESPEHKTAANSKPYQDSFTKAGAGKHKVET